MSVLITASLGGGHLLLRNREIEHLEVVSKFGEPHRCIVRFDLDTNHTDTLQDFHGQLSVEIAREDGSAKAVLFEGVMTGGTQDHQLRGGSRYEVRAASPLLLALEHRTEPMSRHVDWDSVVAAFGAVVVGEPRFPEPDWGYRLFGGSWLEFLRRMADGRGCFVIERDGKVELRSEFLDENRRELVWGAALLAIRASSELVNHRFQGGAFDSGTKSDYRFHDQHKEPSITGAIALAGAVKQAASTFANKKDPNYLLWDSRAVTKTEFRSALQRESERTLGSAVNITGESRDFQLRLGETIQTMEGTEFPLPGSVGVFGLFELTHLWNAAEYRNRFTASPWKNFSNATQPPRPIVPGPFLAEVQETKPEVLAKGLLRVRLAASMPLGDTSAILARLMSPFTGNQRGIVFVPEPGDEVLVDFAQGDPEHPYVLGSLWNPKDKCPGIEPKQIITKNGNVLALHDDGWIELYTPEGKCMLQMSSTADGKPRVTLHSEGDLVLEAKGQIQLRAASLHEAISGGVKRQIGGDETVTVSGRMDHSADGLMKHNGSLASIMTGGSSKLSLTMDAARLAGMIGILDGGAMAVVTGGMVQLNPPVVPPELPIKTPPPQLPGELATTWAKRNVPAPTPKFDSDQDPPPSAS